MISSIIINKLVLQRKVGRTAPRKSIFIKSAQLHRMQESVCFSLHANALGKGKKKASFPPPTAIGK